MEVVDCRALHCPVHSAGDKLGKHNSSVSSRQLTLYKLSCCVKRDDLRKKQFQCKNDPVLVSFQSSNLISSLRLTRFPTPKVAACCRLFHLTSFLTALGSSALLILQPRTGVAGWAEWAMLSNLLNMSDSVPPDHERFSTMSHFFRRELRRNAGNKRGQK